ncbi:MAG TPA: hypothetical protein VFR64_11000 [Methylomirabilota bacterium]|nr:hypothetical protein [Methylomirabilota bacterium]
MIDRAVPSLGAAFAAARPRLDTPWEDETLRRAYAGLPATDLSRHVLERYPEALAVLPVNGLGWNDLGDPRRLLATRERTRTALVSA